MVEHKTIKERNEKKKFCTFGKPISSISFFVTSERLCGKAGPDKHYGNYRMELEPRLSSLRTYDLHHIHLCLQSRKKNNFQILLKKHVSIKNVLLKGKKDSQ